MKSTLSLAIAAHIVKSKKSHSLEQLLNSRLIQDRCLSKDAAEQAIDAAVDEGCIKLGETDNLYRSAMSKKQIDDEMPSPEAARKLHILKQCRLRPPGQREGLSGEAAHVLNMTTSRDDDGYRTMQS